jgi:hypothetical protein
MSHDAAEDLARLVAETERVARHVDDVRVRIAAVAKRRPSSDEISAESTASAASASEPSGHRAAPEADKTSAPSERIPCLDTVSKLLPSLPRSRHSPPDSGVFALVTEPGRYSIIAHRRERGSHVDLPTPVAPKTKVSA